MTLSSSTNSSSHYAHRIAQELRMMVECRITPMWRSLQTSTPPYQELALGWDMTGTMSLSQNNYIGLVFPFGMVHWMANQGLSFPVGMCRIPVTTLPLPKKYPWNVGRTSRGTSSSTTISQQRHVEWTDTILVQSMTSFTSVFCTT